MYKRKDNDIFGTSSIGFAPRIENASYIDPNAAFKKKMEDNYNNYANKITNAPSSITSKPLDSTKVNENAKFEDDYHKTRKETDLQSSIFYPPPPKPKTPQQQAQSYTSSLANSKVQSELNYGRKQTIKRQINNLPYNQPGQGKGNASRLFDMDERVRPRTQQNIRMAPPLIPCQMQWDQHDSVKYAHINDYTKPQQDKRIGSPRGGNQLCNISESMSTVFNQEDIVPKNKKEEKNEGQDKGNLLKKAKSEKEIKKLGSEPIRKAKEPVEIKILKGWDYKFMQGLSKHCKLNGTAIQKFESEDGGKATLVIKRSQRWQNVTDWLRKDAKLKLRVTNN